MEIILSFGVIAGAWFIYLAMKEVAIRNKYRR